MEGCLLLAQNSHLFASVLGRMFCDFCSCMCWMDGQVGGGGIVRDPAVHKEVNCAKFISI